MARQRSSAVPLAWLFAGLVVYASLYPFGDWRVPGHSPLQFLTLAWPPYWTTFDMVANLVGYLPLGALVFGALVRVGQAPRRSALAAVVTGATLSFAMELLQNYLPRRVPSNIDLVLNTAGTACGAAIGMAVHTLGGLERWQSVRQRWFIAGSAGGLALLLLWPLGLLFPAPVPLGLGQLWPRLQEGVRAALEGSAAQELLEPWLNTEASLEPLTAGQELATVALGLLAPCMIALTIAQPGWRRLVLVIGAVLIGAGATTLSTAMNFGPEHALAWRTPNAAAGFALGTLLGVGIGLLPRRVAAGVGLVALSALVALVAHAPADPYFAQSLQAWEQGRFIRFHGAAHWIGLLWPYVALVYLLVRVAARGDD
ncbi:VanZ family protein [uncultured Piscinibacter sp.]|uniref:VanZ family protein n=1 Tax=uncultured Piscinibacter sp. TaxID=1131835 RepID=UPI00260C8F6A|nr:VanZ family protein [uncultured Piscinibacter sp.]